MNQNKARRPGVDLLEKTYGKWWIMLLEGLGLMVLCGILLKSQSSTFSLLVLLIGIYRAIMGTVYLLNGLIMKQRYKASLDLSFVRGIFDVIVAGICIFSPQVILVFIVVIIGIWAIITGIFLVFIALKFEGFGKVSKLVLGLVLLAFGVFTFFNPMNQLDFIAFLLGIALGIFGLFLAIQSFGMKKHYQEIKKQEQGYGDYKIE